MKLLTGSVVLIVAMIGFSSPGLAQSSPLLPGEVAPQREIEGIEELPPAPPDRFGPCVGITDRQERAACIERETKRDNPAVRTLPDARDGAISPERPDAKDDATD